MNLIDNDIAAQPDYAGPQDDLDVTVFYLRAIDSLLRSADGNIHFIAQTHRDHCRALNYRLVLVHENIAEAGAALWPHNEQIDTYIADAGSRRIPAYIKVHDLHRIKAESALSQAQKDLNVAIQTLDSMVDDNRNHDRDRGMLVRAQTALSAAWTLVPGPYHDANDSSIPF